MNPYTLAKVKFQMSIVSEVIQKKQPPQIKSRKNGEPIVVITAYDALFASLFEPHVDMILVGDSLNMSFNGEKDTLSATLEQMIYHTNAVCNGASNSLVILDMPFGSYNTKKEALKNAQKVYQQTKASAIKLEGGEEIAPLISHLTTHGIAVMGHIGLQPQYVRFEGGYKVKGKEQNEVEKLIKDAKALEGAGVFCAIIEGVVSEVATQVAKSVNIPLIGIGAGNGVDGQVLVWSDAFGFLNSFKQKFVKHYLNGAELIEDAIKEYAKEVKERSFPDKKTSY